MCALTLENPFRILLLEPLREVQMVTCLLLMFFEASEMRVLVIGCALL